MERIVHPGGLAVPPARDGDPAHVPGCQGVENCAVLGAARASWLVPQLPCALHCSATAYSMPLTRSTKHTLWASAQFVGCSAAWSFLGTGSLLLAGCTGSGRRVASCARATLRSTMRPPGDHSRRPAGGAFSRACRRSARGGAPEGGVGVVLQELRGARVGLWRR